LPSQVGIDVGLISQVVRYGAIDFFEAKQVEILADGFRGFATPECMDDRIQGDACGGNVIVSVTPLDVLLRHTLFYSSPYRERTKFHLGRQSGKRAIRPYQGEI
jgi:hypothetical protein